MFQQDLILKRSLFYSYVHTLLLVLKFCRLRESRFWPHSNTDLTVPLNMYPPRTLIKVDEARQLFPAHELGDAGHLGAGRAQEHLLDQARRSGGISTCQV